MRKVFRYIFAVIAAAVLLSSCNGDEAEVIPRAKLSEIYAEMLMTDQWITSTPGIRHIADTSLVYEPILEKYGYDSEDYRKTVDKYMDDPERFSRILRSTVEIFDERLEELRAQEKELEEAEARRKRLEKLRYHSDFKPEEFFPYLFDEPYVHYYDSLSIAPDSTLWIYRLQNISGTDTLYDGLRMIVVSDTLAVSDSVAAAVGTPAEKEKEDKLDQPLQRDQLKRVMNGKFISPVKKKDR